MKQLGLWNLLEIWWKNGVIDKLLKNSLNTTKEFYSEQSKFEMRLNPTRTRPFDIIGKLLSRHASKNQILLDFLKHPLMESLLKR